MLRQKMFFIFILLMSLSFTYSQKLDELLDQADHFSMKTFENQKSLDVIMQANKLFPNNWEVNWRISRTLVEIADKMPSSTDQQKDAQYKKYEEAFEYADKAVKLAPNQSLPYIRRAIANGKIALFKGVFSVIGIVNSVREDLEKAIKLNNGGSENQATAHYVLGRTHTKVCEKSYLVRLPLGLGWGDMDEAIKNFTIAVELRPDFRMIRLDFAKAYIQLKDFQNAKDQLFKIEHIAVKHQDDAQILVEAKQLIEKYKNK